MRNETRERILSAAFDLIFAGTFHSVGIEAICQKADVNRGTLYHFFRSKNDILTATLEHFTNQAVAQLENVANKAIPPARKLRELYDLCGWNSRKYSMENGYAPGCFVGNISTELAATDPEIREKAQEAMDRITKVFQPTIAELLAEESLGTANSWNVALTFMGLLQGAQVMAKLRNDVNVFDEMGATIIDVVLAAGRSDIAKRQVA